MNGTLVARPSKMVRYPVAPLARPRPSVRTVLGDYRLVGKSPEGSWQPVGSLELRPLPRGSYGLAFLKARL